MKSAHAAAALAALTLLVPSLGHAQAAAAPSPARLKLAHQIIEAQGGLASISAMTKSMTQSMLNAMGPNLPAEQKQAMQGAVEDVIPLMVPRMITLNEKIYASDFNEKELADILAFYNSSTGKAFATRLPEIGQQTAAAMQQMVPAIQLKMLTRFCEKTACPANLKDGIAQLEKAVPADQRF